MTITMSADTIAYYQREADRKARGMQQYGGDAALVNLRCFKYYHPDQGSWMTDPGGRDRWLAPKTLRIFGVLHREAGTGQRVTMSRIASEVGCCTSTVSRAIQRLQAFGFFAIDITRGRNGGVLVRKRQIGDRLKRYADAAWARIRSWINVASRSASEEVGTDNSGTPKDATFSVELAGARIRAGEISIEEARSALGRAGARPTDADREWQRASEWAAAVIEERRRLDEEEPDWDLHLEAVRASYGMG